MISYKNITRRRFLRILGFLSAFSLTRPSRALDQFATSSEPELLASKLANFFIHKDSASAIGREYLRCAPREANELLLVNLICSSLKKNRNELEKVNVDELRELLVLQQRNDFKNGHIIKVQGWILSETEVRLCALAALK